MDAESLRKLIIHIIAGISEYDKLVKIYTIAKNM